MDSNYIITKEIKKKIILLLFVTHKYFICSINSLTFAFLCISFLCSSIKNINLNIEFIFYEILILIIFILFFMTLYTLWKETNKNKILIYKCKGDYIKLGTSIQVVSNLNAGMNIDKTQSIIIIDSKGKKQKLQNFKYITNVLLYKNVKYNLEIIYLKRSKIILNLNKKIMSIKGYLIFKKGVKNNYVVKKFAKKDKLIQFNDLDGLYNILSKNISLNIENSKNELYYMENLWNNAIKSSKKVDVKIKYNNKLILFDIQYWINGDYFKIKIKN